MFGYMKKYIAKRDSIGHTNLLYFSNGSEILKKAWTYLQKESSNKYESFMTWTGCSLVLE